MLPTGVSWVCPSRKIRAEKGAGVTSFQESSFEMEASATLLLCFVCMAGRQTNQSGSWPRTL